MIKPLAVSLVLTLALGSAALRRVRGDIEQYKGYWGHAFMMALGQIKAEAGETDEAIAAYKRVLANDGAHAGHRKRAEAALQELDSSTP